MWVQHMEFESRTVTTVISPVHHPESSELTNPWRVSDNGADRHVLVSVYQRVCTACKDTEEDGE